MHEWTWFKTDSHDWASGFFYPMLINCIKTITSISLIKFKLYTNILLFDPLEIFGWSDSWAHLKICPEAVFKIVKAY